MIRPHAIASKVLDALFPPRCVGEGCREIGTFICADCRAALPLADGARCVRCWEPGDEESCLSCFRNPPAFAGLRSPFVYTGAPRMAVHALKFDGVAAIAPMLGAEMVSAFESWEPPIDAIVPVPLSSRRQRTRGFNQAHLLAKEVSRATGLRIEQRWLRRSRHTRPQTEQMDAAARRLNVRDAFARGRAEARGNVLLIDDVATTGATLDACARVLLSSGASAVFGLTLARATPAAE